MIGISNFDQYFNNIQFKSRSEPPEAMTYGKTKRPDTSPEIQEVIQRVGMNRIALARVNIYALQRLDLYGQDKITFYEELDKIFFLII